MTFTVGVFFFFGAFVTSGFMFGSSLRSSVAHLPRDAVAKIVQHAAASYSVLKTTSKLIRSQDSRHIRNVSVDVSPS